MGLAIAGSVRLPQRLAPRAASSSLLLLCLSTSFLAQADHLPTHIVQRPFQFGSRPQSSNTCPATLSAFRSFHSASRTCSSGTHFSYHVATAYSAKHVPINPAEDVRTLEPFSQAKISPSSLKQCKDQKDRKPRAASGQDAFFFSQVGTTQAVAFGVADGVGGWAESNIDPADFAHGLCNYMACAARSWPHGGKGNSLHPKDLLQVGYDEVMADKSIDGGGSTASLAVADQDGNVEVANLGDSGFMHLGLNAVRHFTQPQTHAFNTPYQLSKLPVREARQRALFGGTIGDSPNSSSVTHHRVRHGDVLVFASDGVWDNLSPQDALDVVSISMAQLGAWTEKDGALDVSPNLHALTQASSKQANTDSLQARLALALAQEAKKTSENERRDGPFAKEVRKYFPGDNWHGGKPDDIAVVVAVVTEDTVS